MKRVLLTAVAVVTFSAPGFAAPPAGVFNWSGFYIGGNAGYGWNDRDRSIMIVNNLGGPATGPGLDATGPFGGAQLGWNWQTGAWVLGLETDFQLSAISANVGPVLIGANSFKDEKGINWFGTVRGRVGYSFGQLLVYGTGGLAYGEVGNNIFVNAVANPRADQTKIGYVAGGGFEWMLDRMWSAKVEYLHMDLGHSTGLTAPVIPPNGVTIFVNPLNNKADLVRIGLNYKFGS